MEINTGIITWDTQPQPVQKSDDFDWGGTTNFSVKTDDFEIKWSDDEDKDSEEDSDGGLKMKVDEGEPEILEPELEVEQIDVMAQQLKFVACLKILMEELSTLATGFEVDGMYFLLLILQLAVFELLIFIRKLIDYWY